MMAIPKKEYKNVDALIREWCANYDNSTGMCLGLECKCPQLLSGFLACRYFREAVLPIDPVLQAQIMGSEGIKTCEVCGKPFRAVSNRAKYCARCSTIQRKKREAARQRKIRLSKVRI